MHDTRHLTMYILAASAPATMFAERLLRSALAEEPADPLLAMPRMNLPSAVFRNSS